MNAQTTLNSAIAAGFDKLSPRDVMLCVLVGANNAGGATTIAGTGPPVGTPAALGLAYIVVDANGTQWMYYQGAWH
jgi:hypothetical protein